MVYIHWSQTCTCRLNAHRYTCMTERVEIIEICVTERERQRRTVASGLEVPACIIKHSTVTASISIAIPPEIISTGSSYEYHSFDLIISQPHPISLFFTLTIPISMLLVCWRKHCKKLLYLCAACLTCMTLCCARMHGRQPGILRLCWLPLCKIHTKAASK